MATEQTEHALAVELQTSASLVNAALHLLTEHWAELSDDRRRQVLHAARERANYVAERLDASASPQARRENGETSNLLEAE